MQTPSEMLKPPKFFLGTFLKEDLYYDIHLLSVRLTWYNFGSSSLINLSI